MYESVITDRWYFNQTENGLTTSKKKNENTLFHDEVIYEMLIPLKLGNIKEGFKSIFRYLKMLALGHRRRGDVGI